MSNDQSEAVAQKLQELGLSLDPSIPYDLETIFPKIEGWGANKALKQKAGLIQRVESLLTKILRPGEKILFVSKGVQYKFVEQYFLGIWAASVNQTVFILTNVRLVVLHTNRKGDPKKTFWMIYYSQIEKFKASWMGTVGVNLRDGLKLKFSGFTELDRKQMPMTFERTLELHRDRGFDPDVSQSRENLCTFCLQCVPKNQFHCSVCGAEFWHPRELSLRSLVIPSWGDFLMGHTTLAIVELISYGLVWLGILVALVSSINNPNDLLEMVILIAIFIVFSHVPDAWLTYYMAKKGLYPKSEPLSGANRNLAADPVEV